MRKDLSAVLQDINKLSEAEIDTIINNCIEVYIAKHTNKDLIALSCVLVKTVCERAEDPEQVDPVCKDIATFTKMYFKDPDHTDQIFE